MVAMLKANLPSAVLATSSSHEHNEQDFGDINNLYEGQQITMYGRKRMITFITIRYEPWN